MAVGLSADWLSTKDSSNYSGITLDFVGLHNALVSRAYETDNLSIAWKKVIIGEVLEKVTHLNYFIEGEFTYFYKKLENSEGLKKLGFPVAFLHWWFDIEEHKYLSC